MELIEGHHAFLAALKKINGKLYSLTLKIVQIYLMIKIEFFQTNDVNLSKIINKFSEIKKE